MRVSRDKIMQSHPVIRQLSSLSALDSSQTISFTHHQVTGGRNGYGAKLANIFSKEFIVETCDGSRKKRYKQVRNVERHAEEGVGHLCSLCAIHPLQVTSLSADAEVRTMP